MRWLGGNGQITFIGALDNSAHRVREFPPLFANRDVVSVLNLQPEQPAGVETIALPQAIASITLMFVPAETSSGTATTQARS